MATSTTSSPYSVSFSLTPQAKDDVFSLTEQGLADGIYTGATLNAAGTIVSLNVMANDLGGTAKTMYSVDDTSSALLVKDADVTASADFTTAWESTVSGNAMRIVNGMVEFGFVDHWVGGQPVLKNVHTLDQNQVLTDTFTYAIRLANGTLSWASVTVSITGQDKEATGTVGYTGTAAEGGSLTANVVATDADGTITGKGYQWQVKGADGTWQTLTVPRHRPSTSRPTRAWSTSTFA